CDARGVAFGEAREQIGLRNGLRHSSFYRSRIAVTPIPPAAQIEMRPRPEPRSASCLASVATMHAPVAAKGWPMATLEPFGFNFDRSMLPNGPARPSLSRQ